MPMKATYRRLITIGFTAMLVMGATGCSVIMGIFGSDESIMNDSTVMNNTTRILVPTPTAISDEADRVVEVVVAVQPTATTATAPLFSAEQKQPHRSVTIIGDAVNMRRGPGTDTPILRTVPAGTTFELTDKDSTGDWYQICCVGGELAWVYAELAKLGEEIEAVRANPNVLPGNAAATSAASAFTASPPVVNIPSEAPFFTTAPTADGIRYEYPEQGFVITLPPSWQPLDLNQERLAAGLSTLATENPGAAAVVEQQLQSFLNARFTFFAADLTPALLTTGYATTVNLLKQPLPEGISLQLYTQITAKQAQEKFGLTTPVSITPLTLPAGRSVLLTYTMSGGAEIANQPLAVTQYLIMQGQAIFAFTFTTPATQADAYAATFAAIIQSFQLLNE